MAAITLTGTVTKCETRKMTDPDYLGMRRYSPNSERNLVRLGVCLTTADGRRYFFDSPAVGQVVACVPGAAVVTYHFEGTSADWFEQTTGSGVATAERSETKQLLPKVKIGDTLTIRASVKTEKPGYTGLNRVKMIPVKVSA